MRLVLFSSKITFSKDHVLLSLLYHSHIACIRKETILSRALCTMLIALLFMPLVFQAKDLVENSPKPLKDGVTKEEAEAMKAQLEAVGGKVEIK